MKIVRKLLTGLLLLAGIYLILKISKVENWDTMVWAMLLLLCTDVAADQKQIPWLKFLPVGLILLGVPYYFYQHAANVWWKIADWQMTSVRHIWNWDHFFASIPGNDPSWLRRFWTPWLVDKAAWVYNYGFAFAIFGSLIRSFFTKDWRKMLRYTLSTHVLQTPLIIPFYNTVLLHEVWYVRGLSDAFSRPERFGWKIATLNAQNCFPSMHTSISFAVMLLAMREKGQIFKWGMVAYTAAIIASTLYLDIHWIIDVLAGLAFGYGVLKLSDWIMSKVAKERPVTVTEPEVAAVSATL